MFYQPNKVLAIDKEEHSQSNDDDGAIITDGKKTRSEQTNENPAAVGGNAFHPKYEHYYEKNNLKAASTKVEPEKLQKLILSTNSMGKFPHFVGLNPDDQLLSELETQVLRPEFLVDDFLKAERVKFESASEHNHNLMELTDIEKRNTEFYAEFADDMFLKFPIKNKKKPKTIYMSMTWGPKYAGYVNNYCERMNALKLGYGDSGFESEYLIFAHDEIAFNSCIASEACNGDDGARTVNNAEEIEDSDNPFEMTDKRKEKRANNFLFNGRCVRGHSKALGKFTLPMALLNIGYDIVYVDFDTYLIKNPTKLLLKQADFHKVDILIGGSMMDDCINNGFFYIKSTEETRLWIGRFFLYLEDKPFLVDQKLFSAWLGDSEYFEKKRGSRALPH